MEASLFLMQSLKEVQLVLSCDCLHSGVRSHNGGLTIIMEIMIE